MATKLPAWLSRRDNGAYVVNRDIVYPAIFKLLGVKDGEIDQYWLEVAYQIAKLETQEIARLDANPEKPQAVVILITGDDDNSKERWSLNAYKPGRGADKATKGREARAHYERVRGRLAAA